MLRLDDVRSFEGNPLWHELRQFMEQDDKQALEVLIDVHTHPIERARMTGIRQGYENIQKFVQRRRDALRLHARGEET